LVATVPAARLDDMRAASPAPLTEIGRVVAADEGVSVDGEPLADRGYTHS
jgi:thiamine-monophosphate kinase